MIGPQIWGQPPAHRGERAGGAVSTSRMYPVHGAGSSWSRAIATGREAAPHPSGVHVALASGHGRVGLRRGHPRRTVRRAQGCSERLTRAPRGRRRILMGAGGSRTPRAPPAPARRAQRARAEAPRAPRGSGAEHGQPRRSTTLTQMDPVRALAWGCALRGAETHPVTPDMPGARVVGPRVVAVGPQGVHPAERTWPSTRGARPDVRRRSTWRQGPPNHA